MSSSDGKINDLRKRLYSQDQPKAEHNEDDLSEPEATDTPSDWQHDHDAGGSNHKWLNRLLSFAGAVLVLAAGFAIVTVILDSSGVSPNQVDISVSGPDTVTAGKPATLDIRITNRNDTTLHNPVLTVTFPPGTRKPQSGQGKLRRIRKSLDQLNPKETKEVTVSASLFGEQNQTRTIDLGLEYRVAESNAIFSSNSQYALSIGELPISMAVETPRETAPGQPMTMSLDIRSNSTQPLDNVRLTANYPFGFTATEVSPQPSYRNRVWSLGSLDPGDSETITISGRFQSSVSADQRAFQFSAGVAGTSSPDTLETLFVDRTATLALSQPLVDLGLQLDGRTADDSATFQPGKSIAGKLTYKNNADVPLRKSEVRLSLLGSGINLDDVRADDGLYRQPEKQITWNTKSVNDLQVIQPGESGSLQFRLQLKDSENLIGVRQPTGELKAVFRADAPEGSDLPNQINSQLQRSPHVKTSVDVLAETLRSAGPFTNNGPIPPEVNTPTDYTIHYLLRNTTSKLTDVQLQAEVPAGVSIRGEPQMTRGDFTYNDVTGRLQWQVANISAEAGYQQPPAEIFIPVSITPSSGQTNETPSLLEQTTVVGTDTFAETEIRRTEIGNPTIVPTRQDLDTDKQVVQPRE